MKTNLPFAKLSVGSGSFRIAKSGPTTLEARLGTSLGIAAWDAKAQVGGVYHILLPEPLGSDSIHEPEKYALTDVPIFIDALCKKGAKKENIQAVVAGGSLVGPVSEIDLDLDIGGRNTDIVLRKLNEDGIKIKNSDTAGYFSCLLSLNMQNWECSIDPIGSDYYGLTSDIVKITASEIDSAVGNVRPIPQIVLKILRMIHSNQYDMKDIGQEVKQDQVISAKVLKICNSSMFSPKSKIRSIDQALFMLGEKTILQLVVTTSVELFYQESVKGYSLCKGGLYHHAFGVAHVSERISIETGKISSDIAYTGGLLHDIGKVVLDQYVAQNAPFFYRQLYIENRNLIEVEQEVLGITHTAAGKRLAELWSLPEILTEAIALHHEHEQASISPELTCIVYLADLLVSRFRVDDELERLDTEHIEKVFDVLELDSKRLLRIIDRISWGELTQNILH